MSLCQVRVEEVSRQIHVGARYLFTGTFAMWRPVDMRSLLAATVTKLGPEMEIHAGIAPPDHSSISLCTVSC
eukprot:3268264-Rhodomonas_salina.4